MAYKATAWAWDLKLDATRKLVLLALADMADEANSCYPGQERLASMTGITARTVRRCLDDIEGAGLMQRSRRNRADGTRTSDRYTLNVGAQPDNLTTGQGTQDNRTSTTEPSGQDVRAYEPASKNHQKEPPGSAYADDFEEAWKHWPRTNDKRRAYEKWKQAVKANPSEDVTAAIIRHGDEHTRVGTPQQFVPYLKTWLSGEGWNDPLPQSRAGSQPKQTAFHRNLSTVDHFAQEAQHEQARALEAAHHVLPR